jgi:hypothetical protein
MIDGSFGDWSGVPLAATQAEPANVSVAFQNLYVANDESYLYLHFSLYNATNPFTSKQNIFLDTDAVATTGYSEPGLGSEMLIQAGKAYRETNGIFNAGTLNALDWSASPAGTGNEFEVRISRHATDTNGAPVFTNNSIVLALESGESSGNEWLPNGGLAYTFASETNTALGQEFATNYYTVSTEDFPNPERGFYLQEDSYASSPTPVTSQLADYRINGRSSPGSAYTAKISLVLRLFYLDAFVASPISSNYLASIQADFDSIRAQGDKAIVRFAYNKDTTRPFSEPTKAQIMAHIAQLKPLLKKNCDVIAVLQQGLIGAWGEGYYTDNFYTNGQATAQNWLDRADVLSALLAALPSERMVQVRTPQMKQKFVYGPSAPINSAPLDPAQAFNGSDPSRIGFHNDCYLASATDYGTFASNDLNGKTTEQDSANLRSYLAQETRFAPMGGETCAVYTPADDCASVGGNADTDMAFSHYSFLNEDYNVNVNDLWPVHGCIENIKRQLGYRLELISGIFRTEARPGQAIPLTLIFQNVGFASPYNPRGLELILRNTATGTKFFAELSRGTDARRWLPGSNCVLNARLSLPANLPAGNYEYLLNLPDPAPSLYANPAYSIQLANSNAVSSTGEVLDSVWEGASGYHRLGQILTVDATATNALPAGGEIPVLDYSAVAETYDTWRARHFAVGSTTGAPDADPDGDGRVNLLEYAINSDPNSFDSDSCPKISMQNDAVVISVDKGPGVKDVDYQIEGASNLAPANWSTSSVTILENDETSLRATYNGPSPKAFLRLKVSLE